jgi:hypothetical protein
MGHVQLELQKPQLLSLLLGEEDEEQDDNERGSDAEYAIKQVIRSNLIVLGPFA